MLPKHSKQHKLVAGEKNDDQHKESLTYHKLHDTWPALTAESVLISISSVCIKLVSFSWAILVIRSWPYIDLWPRIWPLTHDCTLSHAGFISALCCPAHLIYVLSQSPQQNNKLDAQSKDKNI